MAFTFVLLLAPQALFPALGQFRLALLAATVAIAGHLLYAVTRQRPIIVLGPEVKSAAGLLGLAILSIPFSYWPGGSLSTLVELYLKSLIIFWLLGSVVTSTKRLRQVAWGLSLMTVPLATTGLWNYTHGNFVTGGVQGLERVMGYEAPLTANPNDLAAMLTILLPLSIALLELRPHAIGRVTLLGTVALSVTTIVITLSRQGFIALVVVGAVSLFRQLRRGRYIRVAACLGLAAACVTVLPTGYLTRLSTVFDIDADPTGSAQARREVQNAAVAFVLRNPIVGAGLGSDVLAINEELGPTWSPVHNVYLQYAVDLGLPGLILFLLFFFSCIKSVRAACRFTADVPARRVLFHLSGGIFLSLVSFGTVAAFAPIAYNFYFYYLAGLAVAARSIAGGLIHPGEGAPTPSRLAASTGSARNLGS